MKTSKNTNLPKRRPKLKMVIAYGLLIGSGLVLVASTLVFWMIFRDVKEICGEATQEFEGDCIEALIAYVESDDHSLKEKHKAIWALGEIGDPRALPTLERLYTGKPCVRPCRYDGYICQYQLEKSIRFCKGSSVVASPLQGWCDAIVEHSGQLSKLFCKCPTAPADQGLCHYALNPDCEPNSPGDVILIFETRGGWNESGGPELPTAKDNYKRGWRVLLNDGHIEFIEPHELDKLKWREP